MENVGNCRKLYSKENYKKKLKWEIVGEGNTKKVTAKKGKNFPNRACQKGGNYTGDCKQHP